ncbi:MAG: hypothetical protein GXY86_17105 [Firmicutes bacterium]|nr:hypothetical protein [Bacillota bacterium]
MQWSQLKKRIFERFAQSVKERIDIGSTCYRKMHDQLGRGWISIDKKEILDMSTYTFEVEQYQMYRQNNNDWDQAAKQLHNQNLFSQYDLHNSLYNYLNLSIEQIMVSDNPIIRAMGMLDARLGHKRLQKLDVTGEHILVKRLFHLRCEAEGISIPDQTETEKLTSRIDNPIFKPRKEPDRVREAIEIAKLTKSNLTHNIRSLINKCYQREISETELDTEIAKVIYSGFETTPDPDRMLCFMLYVESNSKLIRTVKHAKGVINLARDSENWLRPFDTWSPESYNLDLQFSSLARHLWTRYDVPLFMDHAWLEGNPDHQAWFKLLGSGKNIRTAPNLPFPLTKKMAHFFLLAPPYYSVEAALRWGQVNALGGDIRLADALLDTRLVRDFDHNEFCLSVIRFLVRNPMLDPARINPIIDYIWNQKFENRVVFRERGVAEEVGPPQPNFSMHGRTVESLLRAVEEWHRQLGRESKSGDLQWRKSGFEEFKLIEGSKESQNMKVWRIRELLSSKELVAEGRQMKHCVASYAQSCHKGFASIWTMDMESELGVEKLLTIEVINKDKLIRQVRGRMNRLPTVKEKDIIGRWALQAGLEVARYM